PTADRPGQGLYRLKPALQRRLGRLADHLAARAVDPDLLTVAALPCGLAATALVALAAEWGRPWLVGALPLMTAARIVLNALDGMVATRRAVGRPWGGYLNDLCDRLTDLLFLGGLFFVPDLDPRLAGAALVATLLASYAGVLSASHGGPRLRGGPTGKADRMLFLSAGAALTALTGSWSPLRWTAVLLIVGAAATVALRARDAHDAL